LKETKFKPKSVSNIFNSDETNLEEDYIPEASKSSDKLVSRKGFQFGYQKDNEYDREMIEDLLSHWKNEKHNIEQENNRLRQQQIEKRKLSQILELQQKMSQFNSDESEEDYFGSEEADTLANLPNQNYNGEDTIKFIDDFQDEQHEQHEQHDHLVIDNNDHEQYYSNHDQSQSDHFEQIGVKMQQKIDNLTQKAKLNKNSQSEENLVANKYNCLTNNHKLVDSNFHQCANSLEISQLQVDRQNSLQASVKKDSTLSDQYNSQLIDSEDILNLNDSSIETTEIKPQSLHKIELINECQQKLVTSLNKNQIVNQMQTNLQSEYEIFDVSGQNCQRTNTILKESEASINSTQNNIQNKPNSGEDKNKAQKILREIDQTLQRSFQDLELLEEKHKEKGIKEINLQTDSRILSQNEKSVTSSQSSLQMPVFGKEKGSAKLRKASIETSESIDFDNYQNTYRINDSINDSSAPKSIQSSNDSNNDLKDVKMATTSELEICWDLIKNDSLNCIKNKARNAIIKKLESIENEEISMNRTEDSNSQNNSKTLIHEINSEVTSNKVENLQKKFNELFEIITECKPNDNSNKLILKQLNDTVLNNQQISATDKQILKVNLTQQLKPNQLKNEDMLKEISFIKTDHLSAKQSSQPMPNTSPHENANDTEMSQTTSISQMNKNFLENVEQQNINDSLINNLRLDSYKDKQESEDQKQNQWSNAEKVNELALNSQQTMAQHFEQTINFESNKTPHQSQEVNMKSQEVNMKSLSRPKVEANNQEIRDSLIIMENVGYCDNFGWARTHFECELCAGTYAISDIVSMISCTHYACKHCLQQYFTLQIRERQRLVIACPFCEEPNIDPDDDDSVCEYLGLLDQLIKHLVVSDVYELFQRKVRDRYKAFKKLSFHFSPIDSSLL
jgi:hypothetical protein